jgi:hypothetical protein
MLHSTEVNASRITLQIRQIGRDVAVLLRRQREQLFKTGISAQFRLVECHLLDLRSRRVLFPLPPPGISEREEC